MSAFGFIGGKEPLRFFHFILVVLEHLPQLGTNWNVAVDRVFLLEPANGDLVFDAILCEDLVLSQRHNLRYPHTCVDTESKNELVSGAVEELEYRLYIFGT